MNTEWARVSEDSCSGTADRVLLRPLLYDHAEQFLDLSHTLAVSDVS